MLVGVGALQGQINWNFIFRTKFKSESRNRGKIFRFPGPFFRRPVYDHGQNPVAKKYDRPRGFKGQFPHKFS